jgi:hypothetical protein
MANSFLTDDMITLEALSIFKNSLAAANHCDRKFEGLFGQKDGLSNTSSSIRIRKPNQYTVRTGATFSAQDITDDSVTLTIGTQIGVDTSITSAAMALSLSSFSEQIIRPQVTLLANYVDNTIMSGAFNSVYNSVGTPGTVPSALSTYLDAGAKLDEYACPRDGQRAVVIGPQMQSNVVDALKGLFETRGKISSQYDSGEMGKAVGFNWQMDQNTTARTSGALGGTPLIKGTISTGATSITTDGWTASTLVVAEGDVFTIADVYSVNPVGKTSTGQLQQFVVTAAGTSDGSGDLTISVSPSIISTGATQTVSALPADNAALTFASGVSVSSAQGMAWHKSAIALAFAELQKPQGVDQASVKTDKQIGVSMRFVRQWDVDSDVFKSRFDVLFGYKVVRPEWVCRIQSGAA